MTVEIETVFETADAMQAAGITPSVRKMQDRLDAGRHGYIAPFLALWTRREEDMEKVQDLPEDYVKAALQSALRIWEMAQDNAGLQEAILVREIARLNRQVEEMEATFRVDAQAKGEAWEEERATLLAIREEHAKADVAAKTKMIDLEREIGDLKARIVATETEKVKAEARMDAAEMRCAELAGERKRDAAAQADMIESLQSRAVRAEQREAAMEERLQDARLQLERDAKRIDDLLARLVDLMPEAPTGKRPTEQSPASA